jgi:amino acid transporter
VHPKGNFPYVSILFLGSIAFIFSLLFRLSDVISAILAMRILVQFIGQAIGLLSLTHTKRKDFPYKMPFFPWPVYIAIAMWICILISTGIKMAAAGTAIIALGIVIYFVKARLEKKAALDVLKE